MRSVEYLLLAIKKKKYEIWSILQGVIVIPAKCIFEDKMASAPGALKIIGLFINQLKTNIN